MTGIYGASMKIRDGKTEDAKMLSELGARTFYDTFAKDNTPENIDAYLKKSFSPDIQLNELLQPAVVFLIAEVEGIPVGYAQLILSSRDEQAAGDQEDLRLTGISRQGSRKRTHASNAA